MSVVKFLVNTAIVGAIAGGVYYYLDQNAKRNAADAEDPDLAPHTLDPENIKDAADRAYTTLCHGSEEVANGIKKSVGPQGEEMMSEALDAAGKVKETVTFAGRKVGDIVTDTDYTTQEKASAVADTVRYAAAELRDKFSRKDEAEEAAFVPSEDPDTAAAEEETPADAQEAAPEAETETAAEPVNDAAKIEEFFDDDAN